ncbi:LacI family DNA-binding transcriptional regulator [Candidatus Galacturonibacter soehngenii]|uniref:LacI family transcriptional regulator n=1 Tax=Candidatus Galacturonatibacter soehngenii TaxID=2307010 RepID=A0A7V7QJU6_9FIRM|nr:LacI family DNA-binding transcriptional regulator [Candidatus Galacturonibacter soehngenii]KAB1437638.1 LacI family transcriptional regulator [Candidatus Galacturonibacter soehngenii]MBA4686864.1 LacI family DNA-binding transcriptional regulator [Candidatus Galacturonibacter soehngenii]
MAVTIKDVAREAGVSVATVSKILNNKPYISEKTRQHVKEVMKQLDYHPNAQASNFKYKRSNNIIFLAITQLHTAFHNPHMFEILCGAESVTKKKKYNLSFVGVSSTEEAYTSVLEIVGRNTADGILVHGSATSRHLVDFLVKSNFPHIIIGRPPFASASCWIDINNRMSGQMAMEYLETCGYSKIAFLGGPKSDEISRHRLQGFLSYMNINGLTTQEDFIKYGEYTKESGFTMMEELLSYGTLPDAVICENNLIAMGAVKAIENKNLSIPKDIGMITFDDYPLSQLIDPPLTVIDIDVYEMGNQAATILLRKINNKNLSVQSFVTLPNLIVRSSTRNPRTKKDAL